MTKLTAEKAIENIKAITTTVFGQTVRKFNYGYQHRAALQAMAENNEISPKEYYKALKLVWDSSAMLDSCKRSEFEILNK